MSKPLRDLILVLGDQHETRLHGNPRMSIQLANLQRRRQDRDLTRQTRAATDAVIKRYFQ